MKLTLACTIYVTAITRLLKRPLGKRNLTKVPDSRLHNVDNSKADSDRSDLHKYDAQLNNPLHKTPHLSGMRFDFEMVDRNAC